MTIFRSLPIRWRLTIWYVSLLAVTLAVFAAAVTIGLRIFLQRSLDNTLDDQAALLTESVNFEDGEATIGDRRIRNRPGEQLVRLVDRERNLLNDSSSFLDELSMDDDGLELALDGQRDIRWRMVQDERMRVLSQPVMIDDEVVAAVQVGLSADSSQSILEQTVLLITTSGAIVIVCSVVGGVWLARRTLRPIDRMTRLAARIGDHDLSQRISPPSADDELGRLALTFNAMLDRLEAAMNRQRQFTASASHELRTPLAMMQSQIELALARERQPEDDAQVLSSLHADVERLTRISNTLLSLSRSDSGEIELANEPVDLSGLLELVGEQYEPLASKSGIDLSIDAEPVDIRGDEDRLVQMLVNLVDNAFQHTPAGRGVWLSCRSTSDSATVSVVDEGSGIDPAQLPYVFERFYRADSGRYSGHNGAGLGLSITRTIVDAHGGSIDIYSEEGAGTTVAVSLPRNGPPGSPRANS